MTIDQRLEVIEGVLEQTAIMFGMSPVFAPQTKMLEICQEDAGKIRQELKTKYPEVK